MEVPAETKISLKAFVDKESNKVIFVEADNDFIDVLFSFLTIPMGRIVRFARDDSEPQKIGCMNKLYQTIEKLDEQIFRSNVHRDMLLHPRTLADCHCKNLKLKLIDNNEPTLDIMCSSFYHYPILLSYCKDVRCPNCSSRMSLEVRLSGYDSQTGGVFVKEQSRAMITDDLQVIPPLSVASISLFNKLGEMNSNSYEERTFCIGAKEVSFGYASLFVITILVLWFLYHECIFLVLNLLVSSLVSKTPFTETLLKNYPAPNFSVENFGPGKSAESQMLGATKNEEKENISVNLIVSKSKNVVCYAEVREDFVNLLFSFMTLPLGYTLVEILDFPWKGCTDRLWKGVLDLDKDFLKSNCSLQHVPGWFEYKVYRSHGFSKGPAIFTVTDNLDVRLVSPSFQLSVLNDLKVPLTDIEGRTVSVGNKEALNLLVSSFLSDSVLTNAFLRNPKG